MFLLPLPNLDKPGHGGTRLQKIEIPTKEPILHEQPINHHVSPESKGKVEKDTRESCNAINWATFETKVSLHAEEVGNVQKLGGEMEEHPNGDGESKANVAPRSSIEEEHIEGFDAETVMEESLESLFSISIGKNQ
ncbi:unnamed protein product [Linum trigynum]|uniref:Uncharacterized protein n=1 Tax=Linum trigynum TaxID=586398 RepID=A0AAV2GL85_9ROSI